VHRVRLSVSKEISVKCLFWMALMMLPNAPPVSGESQAGFERSASMDTFIMSSATTLPKLNGVVCEGKGHG